MLSRGATVLGSRVGHAVRRLGECRDVAHVSSLGTRWRRRCARRGVASAAVGASSAASDVPSSDHVSLVQGASRGIGLEMVRQLLERPDASMPGRRGAAGGRVVATCRDPASATALAELRARYPARLSVLPLDVTDVPSIEAAAAAVAASHGRVDVILNVAAVLHVEGEMKPETSLARLDEAAALRAYRVNALGPTLVAKHFAGLLTEASRLAVEAGGAPAAVANLSARVSSVGDNRLGGWHSYRASKTALNQLTKNCAIEFARKKHPVTFLLLHPGTVETDLSAPFRRNVPEGKLFKVNFSAERLLGIVGDKTQADTGKFFAWDGEEIQW